jgi:hypothetical protein
MQIFLFDILLHWLNPYSLLLQQVYTHFHIDQPQLELFHNFFEQLFVLHWL